MHLHASFVETISGDLGNGVSRSCGGAPWLGNKRTLPVGVVFLE